MSKSSRKDLLERFVAQEVAYFKLTDTVQAMYLPVVSALPFRLASPRFDLLRRDTVGSCPHVDFITKNGDPQGFVWRTTGSKLKEAALRYGIIKPESLTGRVNAALGEYRIVALERIAKGMISNTHRLKIQLLDYYQQRFEAMQVLESITNQKMSAVDLHQKLLSYYLALDAMKANLKQQFADTNIESIRPGTIKTLEADIDESIARLRAYQNKIAVAEKNRQSLDAFTQVSGNDSLLQFIRKEMTYDLYALQGINQDITFSGEREFAATRGDLNSRIEDARKEVDDYQADPRNSVTDKHHGIFGGDNEEVAYDFSADGLSPERERQVLLAISFIEGYDSLTFKPDGSTAVTNALGETRELAIVAATTWRAHKTAQEFFKHLGYKLLNMLKSAIFPTREREGNPWGDGYELTAYELRRHAGPNDPLWKKPFYFIAGVVYGVVDIFMGIKDVGMTIAVKMPKEIIKDWSSTAELSTREEMVQRLDKTFAEIEQAEKDDLDSVLFDVNSSPTKPAWVAFSARVAQQQPLAFATVDYHLTSGDRTDFLTASIDGINGAANVFFDEIFRKDPVGGLAFCLTYGVTGLSVLMPHVMQTIVSPQFVALAQQIGGALASTPVSGAISGAAISAQSVTMVWDAMVNGPKSMIAKALEQVTNDPLTMVAYGAFATGLGYGLANGIGEIKVPVLSEILHRDLGTLPQLCYPLFGAKFSLLIYEVLRRPGLDSAITKQLQEVAEYLEANPVMDKAIVIKIERAQFAYWLVKNQPMFKHLDSLEILEIQRHIDSLYDADEAKSLQKFLQREEPQSIAHQLLFIPLSYVPAVLRLLVSPIVALAALIAGRPYPLAPVKNAAVELLDKAALDLTRLVVFGKGLLNFGFNAASALIKLVPNVVYMGVGRVAGQFGVHTSHAVQHVFAMFSVAFKSLAEFLNPGRVLRSVITAHPIDTATRLQSSYLQTKRDLEVQAKVKDANAARVKLPLAPIGGDSLPQQRVGSLSVFAARELVSPVDVPGNHHPIVRKMYTT